MRMRDFVALAVVLCLALLPAGCSKSEPPKPAAQAPAVSPAVEGKALFEQKCSVCHGLDRATARQETKEKWTSIVKEMQGKKADWISDADAAKIVEFLASEHGKK
ncbi:MAG: cytochrome c [Deltaproteobacteria bacterium]|nr:cytochrome c [Deltaproteobacteria bacterium]